MTSFRDALARELEAAEEAHRERFGDELLSWFALVPAWPEALARRCQFPADLSEVGPKLQNAGLAQHARQEAANGSFEVHWWAPASTRRTLLAEQVKRGRGHNLAQIADHLARQVLHDVEAPPSMQQWATLVRSGQGADRALRSTVSNLVARGDTGEALSWIESARVAADLLGGTLETGIVLAERRIELAYRREHDEKLLARFLERPEQTRWIEDLLAAANDLWALHLLGVGGVGKTMLIRYVMTRLAPERGLVAVKVDFDHLSPDYPIRRPGQLIAALAEELSVHVQDQRLAQHLQALQGRLTTLNEVLSAELPPSDPLANVRRQELDYLLEVLAEMLQQLPAPFLLVLDTCEELAKLRFETGRNAIVPPAVAATFELLERLQLRVPSMRVLFAGRRFLASAGPGWHAGEREDAQTRSLPVRTYLALQELRGFDEEEAAQLFRERFGLDLSPQRRRDVLARSPELGSTRIGRPGESRGGERARYHPFDLALYAHWLQQDPNVDLSGPARDGDAYVERRILGRIQESNPRLRQMAPVLVILRRFNPSLLEAALDLHGEALAELLRAFGEQEWSEVQPDDESEDLFYEIHRPLWPRLARFFAMGAARDELERALRLIAPRLEAYVRGLPASRLRAEYLDAAVRSLEPAAGGALWDAVELRALNENADTRLRGICERLLGEDAAAAEGRPLRPQVLATYVGLRARAEPDEDLTPYWNEVEASASTVPLPDTREWIAQRVIAARAASYRHNPLQMPTALIGQACALTTRLLGLEWPRDAIAAHHAATLLAAGALAIEALLGLMQRLADASPERALLVRAFVGFARQGLNSGANLLRSRGVPLDLVVAVRLLSARLAAADGAWDEAGALFDRTIAECEQADAQPRTQVLDSSWIPSLAVRARIERAALAPLESVGFRYGAADPDPTGERKRLLAHERCVALARGEVLIEGDPLAAAGLPKLSDCLGAAGGLVGLELQPQDLLAPSGEAARAVPWCFSGVVRTYAALGAWNHALAILEHAIDLGLKVERATEGIDAAERDKLWLLRRYRVDHGHAERIATRFGVGAAGPAYLVLSGAQPPGARVSPPAPSLEELVRPGAVEGNVRGVLVHQFAVPAFRTWLESLPGRFVAELALEEGEVLAVSDPAAGAELLGYAFTKFEAVSDRLGMLFAATLLLPARQRAGASRAALEGVWFHQVRPALQSCTEALGWPALTELEAGPLEQRLATGESSAQLWGGWLARIAAWAKWFASHGRGPSAKLQEGPYRHEFPEPSFFVSGLTSWHQSGPDSAASPHGMAHSPEKLSIRIQPDSDGVAISVARLGLVHRLSLPDLHAPYVELTWRVSSAAWETAVRSAHVAELEIESARLARLPWEATLPPPNEARRSAVRVRRGRSARPRDRDSALVASPRWRTLFSPRDGKIPCHHRSVEEARDLCEGTAIVVGTPIETRAGIALRVEDDAKRMLRTVKATRSREGGLLRPESVGILAAPLVLLFAEPVDALAHGPTERLQAGFLRELSHVVAESAGTVLAVPALPEALASEVFQEVLSWVFDEKSTELPEAEFRRELVARVRSRILETEHSAGGDDGRAEAALDVVLYGAMNEESSN